ncbi:ankyrin repeat domain-containing protein SOWAHC [Hemicordylus capensis]|uniref:ankyrin repeat domain-containing protein SOWAHC n=1 Tax=Hemicordylus capensis TaxID=884348 RepID=UPI0023026CBC|nr:ankyrin repeat domain-containing protein SOWAHC [Hemicordylus capensis]
MAASVELDQDAVLRFLAERGGRARNADLLEHFRGFLNSPEPQRRARARECFKELVNAVAVVRQEPGSGAKYVQLRKKYRSAAASSSSSSNAESSAASAAGVAPVVAAATTELTTVEAPHLPPEPQDGSGNRNRTHRSGDAALPVAEALKGEEGKRGAAAAQGSVSDASAPSGESVPGGSSPPAPTQRLPEEPPSPSGTKGPQPSLDLPEGEGGGRKSGMGGPSSDTAGLPGGEGEVAEAEEEPCAGSGGAQPEDSSPCSPLVGSLAAAAAAAGSGIPATPNVSRCGSKNFRERMLGSSPQLKRSGLLPRGSSSGGGGSSRGGGDSDSASLASSSAEDESGSGGSVALDPLEHAWMLCASEGRWENLEGLLSCEPGLFSKRDFITGFTCLHWAAKHGRHELLAMLVNFAHRHRLPVNINARTSGGYTALHLAAMHGHLEVVKLLVGAYDADVDIRDYSGRKASHYLSRGTAEEVGSLVGALQDETDCGAPNGSGRWRLSKVLPSNLITYKLSHLHHRDEGESGEGTGVPGKGKELSRKTSGSGRIKPRLNKIRFRTQIIHTTPSFQGDTEEEGQEKSLKASFKLRPKSNVFG